MSSQYRGYDHITWLVGNAKQAASYFIARFGFHSIAYRGLETGSRVFAYHVVSNQGCTIVLKSPLRSPYTTIYTTSNDVSDCDKKLIIDAHMHLSQHGDAVKDVAFEVDDAVATYQGAMANGVQGVCEPTIQQDAWGKMVIATVRAFGDTTHTFVERSRYLGTFLPGFESVTAGDDPLTAMLPAIPLVTIDHCVGNQDWGGMQSACEYYEKGLGFHRFWSIDDGQTITQYSSMNSVVVASQNNVVKMPLNEPATGLKKSQIEEFVDYYGGPGVQHIALRTDDIVGCVTNLRQRGVDFINVPNAYYDEMRQRLSNAGLTLHEDIAALQELNVLIDFDEGGYLLQLFTKPLCDRPTVFIEIIQRHNFDGFGAGNFKALFEAIEREQAERGNL